MAMKLDDITRPLLRNKWTRIPAAIILWPPAIAYAIIRVVFSPKLQEEAWDVNHRKDNVE